MPSPYNLTIQDHCTTCAIRKDRQFCNLSTDSVSSLDTLKFTSFYPKGSVLFVEGEDPRGVFILCNGRAKLTTSSSEGKTLIVSIAEPGEILGVSASILGTPCEVSAETIEPTQVNFIRREDFLRFIASHPDAAMHAAQALSAKYQAAQREIRSLGLAQTTSERLAKLLLDWCDKGEVSPKGIRLKVLLTHEEIGQMIGTTRETVTRLLSDFKRKKVLEVKGSTFYVTKQSHLTSLVTT
jgi:CRP/FNR family cyclic AMP-dependent transcriptional regulator